MRLIDHKYVRSGYRIVMQDVNEVRYGNSLPSQIVDRFKASLEEQLAKRGYLPLPYSSQPDTKAYIKRDVPFRQEPILIDDGGERIGGLLVLKVAVREAKGENAALDQLVRGLLISYRIEDPTLGASQPCQEGTKVYALKRTRAGDRERLNLPNMSIEGLPELFPPETIMLKR